MKNIMQFLDGVGKEFKKVAWPTFSQLIGATWIVLIFVSILALYLGGVDLLLVSALRKIVSL